MTVTLHLGDCLEYMKTMPDKSVDAVITDLPYGTTACAWDVIIPFAPMWEQVERICRGAFITTASQPFTSKLIMSNIKRFRYEWIWEKTKATGHAFSKHQPMRAHENILVFCDNAPAYNYLKEKGRPYKQPRKNYKYDIKISDAFKTGTSVKDNIDGGRFPRTIISFKNAYYSDGEQKHPTQKPVALYKYLVQTYSNVDNTILDICMGSGTTGVACVQLGRNFIGCEIDPKYFAIAEKRIHAASLQPQLFKDRDVSETQERLMND
jgi:DNA modification methylase